MNENGFPQSSTAHRRWRGSPEEDDTYTYPPESATESHSDTMPESILASFLVRVQFRQNASWQGTLIWLEKKESCAFRSLLEMLTLIADALRLGSAQEQGFASHLITRTLVSKDNLY